MFSKNTAHYSHDSRPTKLTVRHLRRYLFAIMALTFAIVSSAMSQNTVYNALPGTLAPTYPSQPFQAGQAREFGDYVQLAGTSRVLKEVTVTLVDWALYADSSSDIRYSADSSNWTHPVTINVYNVVPGSPNILGSLLGSVTQTVTIPWRPAEDPVNCPTKDNPGYAYKWQSVSGSVDTNCHNGIAANVTIDMSSLNLLLPNDVIIGVAYNTQSYGAAPVGSSGPYNSLNVGVTTAPAPSIGTDGNGNDKVFFNSLTAGQYGDGGAGGTGTFREDLNWAPYGTVPIKITAIPNILYVDTDGTAGPTGCSAGSAYPTITAAIGAAAPGDIIQVCPGTYPEAVNVNKSVTILGSQAGGSACPTRSGAETIVGTSVGAFYATANDVVIDGFTASNATAAYFGSGIIVGAGTTGVQVRNTIIENNIFGLSLGGSNSVISGNRFQNNNQPGAASGNGIYTDQFSSGGSLSNVAITGNCFIGHGGASGSGINLAASAPGAQTNINISGNTFTANAGPGLSGTNVSGLTVANNIFSGNFQGVLLSTSIAGVTITGNDINTSAGAGIRFGQGVSNVTMTGNTVRNNGSGIRVTPSSPGGASSMSANFNRIVGNGTNGLEVNANYTGPFNAENNWWGCNYGPGATGPGCTGPTPNTANGIAIGANPWLKLTTSAATPTVTVGGTDLVTSLLTINSNNLPSGGFVPNGTPASFVGTFGTVTTSSSVTTSGATTTTFAGTSGGVGGVATTVDGQTVSAPIVVYPAACAGVSMPVFAPMLTGGTIVVPVNTDEMTGRGAISLDTTITYNPSVLTIPGGSDGNNWNVTLGSVGNSNGGHTLTVRSPSPGTLIISVFGINEFQGSGALVNLSFNVIGLPLSSSTMAFSPFTYNELNDPCAVTTNGQVNIISGTISGTVTYGNALNGGGPSPRHVPNTTVFAAGTPTDVSTLTANDGTYSLSGMGAGAYTVTPSKSGDDQGAMSSLDSGCIAQHVVGMPTNSLCGSTPALNATQLLVADVSGAGGVSSFDAGLIARYVASLLGSGNTGQWKFTPVNIGYLDVNTNYSGQDYVALLMGDVTGNWRDINATRPAIVFPEGERPMRIAAPELSAPAGTEVLVPVSVQDTTGKSILGYQFTMTYDPTVLEPSVNTADLVGTISEGMSATVNSTERGRLTVVVFGANALVGAGDLLKLRFNVIGDVDSGSDLSWEIFAINEGGINFETKNGRVVVRAASDDAAIKGRVVSAAGQPVSGATVTITDTTGQVRRTRSSSLGNFAFADLTVGQTYTVNVSAKRFTFAPRTVSVTNDAVSMDMIAEQ